MTYRVDNHQPQNIYRDDAYIGVMFTAEDAALVVEALNQQLRNGCFYCGTGIEAQCPQHAVPSESVADSCTCPPPYGRSIMPDPLCPVHQGRRARGPKPPPLGAGCICDGSGRTCPRHGAVM